jgi:hypothetical protein
VVNISSFTPPCTVASFVAASHGALLKSKTLTVVAQKNLALVLKGVSEASLMANESESLEFMDFISWHYSRI